MGLEDLYGAYENQSAATPGGTANDFSDDGQIETREDGSVVLSKDAFESLKQGNMRTDDYTRGKQEIEQTRNNLAFAERILNDRAAELKKQVDSGKITQQQADKTFSKESRQVQNMTPEQFDKYLDDAVEKRWQERIVPVLDSQSSSEAAKFENEFMNEFQGIVTEGEKIAVRNAAARAWEGYPDKGLYAEIIRAGKNPLKEIYLAMFGDNVKMRDDYKQLKEAQDKKRKGWSNGASSGGIAKPEDRPMTFEEVTQKAKEKYLASEE